MRCCILLSWYLLLPGTLRHGIAVNYITLPNFASSVKAGPAIRINKRPQFGRAWPLMQVHVKPPV